MTTIMIKNDGEDDDVEVTHLDLHDKFNRRS